MGRDKAVVATILSFLLASCSSPWGELEARYRAKAAASSSVEAGKTIGLLATGYRGVFTYNGIVSQSFGDTGVYLAIPSKSPVSIPASAVAACSRTQWSPGWDTNLWVAAARVDISFPDNDGQVLAWCNARKIVVVERQAIYKWLYPGDGSWGTR